MSLVFPFYQRKKKARHDNSTSGAISINEEFLELFRKHNELAEERNQLLTHIHNQFVGSVTVFGNLRKELSKFHRTFAGSLREEVGVPESVPETQGTPDVGVVEGSQTLKD